MGLLAELLALFRDGIPRACSTWTVILRIGASYRSDTSSVPFGQLVDVGLSGPGPIVPVSDLSDLRSLVSNRGSCDRTTMHCEQKKITLMDEEF